MRRHGERGDLRMTCRVLASFDHALNTLEPVMHKRRLARNEIPMACVREDGEGDRCEAEVIAEIDFDPGDRDSPPSRAIHLSGCPHVETYTEEEYERVQEELDDMPRDMRSRYDD